MKIDFHTHTSRYSACSSLTANDLLEYEAEAGVEGVVLTEHERFWPEPEFEALQQQHDDLVLFNGTEVRVGSLHHVLTLLPEPNPDLLSIEDPRGFIDRAQTLGGYLIAAHPFRFYDDYDQRNREYRLDGIEVASRGMYRPGEENRARNLARAWDADCFANSDAHSPAPIGAFYCEVDGHPRTEAELLESLRNGGVQPVVRREQFPQNRYS
jgi:predicted metal-dependent phosphoesterase TrpH